MTREETLHKLIDELDENVQIIGHSLVDRMIYLENKLLELEKLPFYQVNPKNLYQQRELPARKIYVGVLQQYNITIKSLLKLLGVNIGDDGNDEFKKYLASLNAKLSGE